MIKRDLQWTNLIDGLEIECLVEIMNQPNLEEEERIRQIFGASISAAKLENVN